jgi:hypothetical protein
VIDISLYLVILIEYSQRHIMLNLCDWHITLLSDIHIVQSETVSLRRVICLSQWFIMVCLWLYCISITKKTDMFIRVIYHGMSLTVLYQYHCEIDISLYLVILIEYSQRHIMLNLCDWHITLLSDIHIVPIKNLIMLMVHVSVSLRRLICQSQWFIMVCLWLYYMNITKKSDMSITEI